MNVVLGPGEGRELNALGLKLTTKATRADTAGAYAIFEAVMSADRHPHVHKTEEEAIYILEGETEILVGERTVEGTPGSFVVVPRGTVHGVTSKGPVPAKALLIFSPPGIEGLFAEVDGQTDMNKIMAAVGRYNTEDAEPSR